MSEVLVACGHLVDLVGCSDERLAERPHVARAAEREGRAALVVHDLDVPTNCPVWRLGSPDFDHDVVVVLIVAAVDEPLRPAEVPARGWVGRVILFGDFRGSGGVRDLGEGFEVWRMVVVDMMIPFVEMWCGSATGSATAPVFRVFAGVPPCADLVVYLRVLVTRACVRTPN